MNIIKIGNISHDVMRITCGCGTIFEVEKKECNTTSQLGVMHDGMGAYNINCPICGANIDFDWEPKQVLKEHYSLCPMVDGEAYPRCLYLKDRKYCTAKPGEECRPKRNH